MRELIRDPIVTSNLPHKYLGMFGMIWITFLLVTIFTSLKTFDIFGFTFVAVAIGYPVTYIFSDIFTEVYGYRVSRKIIWSGFLCIAIGTSVAYLYTLIPPSQYFGSIENNSFNLIFRASPLIAFATILGFWLGELTNSFILAKLKLFTKGKKEWLRYILSTFFGQLVDNTVGVTTIVLRSHLFSQKEGFSIVVTTVIFCTVWEMIASPITHPIIRFIKKKEGIDTYDVGTKFNPFVFK